MLAILKRLITPNTSIASIERYDREQIRWRGRPQNILLAKLASFALAINKPQQKQAADAKQVQWVAGADAPDGFPCLKHEIWPRNE